MDRRLVLVVGPHRSGTSMTAAALRMLGAELRLPGIYANPENPKGFYEQPEAIALNDELLSELGATWDTPTFVARDALSPERFAPERREAWVGRIAGLIGRVLGDAPLGAIKDPRICLLAPIWIEAARRAGIAGGDLAWVYVHRDPVEVAVSQRVRTARTTEVYEFGRSLAEGASLWLSYTGQLLEATEGQPVVLVPHHALMEDPIAAVTRLAGALSLPADPERIGEFARDFVSGEHYRSRSGPAERDEVAAALPAVPEIAALLDGAAASGLLPEAARHRIAGLWRDPACQAALARAALPSLGRLNRKARQSSMAVAELSERLKERSAAVEALTEELAKQAAAYAEAFASLQRQLADRIASTDRVIADLESEKAALLASLQENRALENLSDLMAERSAHYEQTIASLEREKAALLASLSWRITAPLRALRAAFR